MTRLGDGDDPVKCSFCGKSQKAVKKVVAGPGVYTCDECIGLCNEILLTEGFAPPLAGFVASAQAVSVPRGELTAVARALDQVVGAVEPSNPRLADEASRLATRLHQRLQAAVEDPNTDPGGPVEG